MWPAPSRLCLCQYLQCFSQNVRQNLCTTCDFRLAAIMPEDAGSAFEFFSVTALFSSLSWRYVVLFWLSPMWNYCVTHTASGFQMKADERVKKKRKMSRTRKQKFFLMMRLCRLSYEVTAGRTQTDLWSGDSPEMKLSHTHTYTSMYTKTYRRSYCTSSHRKECICTLQTT